MTQYYYRNVQSGLSNNITPKKLDDLYRSVADILLYLESNNVSKENTEIISQQFLSNIVVFSTEGMANDDLLHQVSRVYLSLRKKHPINGDIKISVVMPVYNGEKYLRRTLNSLTLQSLYDIEIICVNDASTDDSLAILLEYQSEDPRIKVIDCKKNGGESKARNIGIHAASGEYIAFMDQDDCLDLLFYEKLYEKAKETGADIVKGNACEVLYDGNISKRFSLFPIEKQSLYFTGDWWTAIYRRNMIIHNHIELPEGYPLGGDLKFLFDACIVANKVNVIRDVTYYHLMHPDSGDSEVTPLYKVKSVLDIFSYILNKIEQIELYNKDCDCYNLYYYSYIQHTFLRSQRCPELEGKRLCSEYIFKFYDACLCKEKAVAKLRQVNPLLADILKMRQKSFFDQLLEQDALSSIFYEKRESVKVTSVPCTIVAPYIRDDFVDKYIIQNPF